MPDPFKIVINAVSAQPIVLAPQVNPGQKLTVLQGPITIVGTQLVPATNSILGGIIVGSNLSITNNGILSACIPPQGVTAFNNRTGDVTLTANDVTAVANGIYQANGSYLACATTALTVPSGSELVTGLQANTSTYQIFSGTGAFGSAFLGVRSLSSNTAISYIQCNPQTAPFGKVTIYHNGATLTFNDRGLTAGSTANFTWGSNDFSTVGFNDARYQNATNNTWSNLTGKPTFATVATSGSYTDLANTPNLSLYYLANNPTGYITAACLSYGNISGTPNLSLYQLASTNTWANLTGTPTLANVAISGDYSDLSGTPNLSLYPLLAANNSFTGCNTFTGQINCNSTLALSGNLVTAPKIQAYSETANAPAISSGNLTLNLSLANVFGPVTLNANISNLTISNPPANGTAGSFTLLFKANGTAFTVTWPAAVKWAGGTAPTLTSTANKTDIFTFVTTDGGTNYYGFKAGQNF